MTKSTMKLPKSPPVFVAGDLIKPKANLEEIYLVVRTKLVSPGVWDHRVVLVWKSENREHLSIGDSFPWDGDLSSHYEKVTPGLKVILTAV